MKQTKKELLKNKLEEQGYIENYWCWRTGITTRLSRYIEIFRKEGMHIITSPKTESKDTRYILVTESSDCDCCGWDDSRYTHEPNCSSIT